MYRSTEDRNRDRDFSDSLNRNDLAWASNLRSEKLHIVRLRAKEIRGEQKHLLWDGFSICGANSGISYYLWDVWSIDKADRCDECLRRWRKMGEPDIKLAEKQKHLSDEMLPFGWRPSEPQDAPKVKVNHEGKDETGEVPWQGKELHRWVRGSLFVAIVEMYGENKWKYGVIYGSLHNNKEIGWHTKSGEKSHLFEKARTLMAIGGK